ncbi:MAG: CDP-alcohol phosphatidyltransferase family protein [Desulfobacteraceae bacterium]|nr:CDP-alcohol phosphatidyltransferase family protein [Desulfobacteraceae bacterium]
MINGNIPQPKGIFLLVQFFTVVRIPLAILLALLLAYTDKWSYFNVLSYAGLIGLIEISDLLDGHFARKYRIVTEWGAMLDPYADSVSRLITYWGLAMAGLVIPLVPLAMALRDITVAYCRITLTRFGKTVSAKRSGKIKAIFQGVGAVIIIFGPLHWSFTGKWTVDALSWLIIGVTLISAIEYAAGAISAATAPKS